MNRLMILFVFLILYSCSTTKYLQKGEYIINNVKIEIKGNNQISSAKFYKFLQTRPLRKTFFIIPLHAWIYNIPNSKKIHSREEKKQIKLKRINDRRIKKYDQKTYRYIKKRIAYKRDWNKYKEAGDSLKALKFYHKYLEYDRIIKDRQRNRAINIAKIQKKDVFLFSDIFYKLGEKPQTYDTTDVIKTVSQFKLYLQRKGYFHPKIQVVVNRKRKKVNIKYIIIPGRPHLISTVKYNVPEDTLKQLIYRDIRLQLKTNVPLDAQYLENYRKNFTNDLKDKGYYFFVKDYITYLIDTTKKPFSADIIVNFYDNKEQNNLIYKPWTVKDVYIFSDYNPTEAIGNPKYFSHLDTISILSRLGYNYMFVKDKRFVVKPKLIREELYIYPAEKYNFTNVKTTYRHLSKFKIYKLINIQFQPVDTLNHYLDCDITLSPGKIQGIITEIEGTNNSGNLGAAFNIKYQNKNLFRGGEILELKGQTAIERQTFLSNTEKYASFNTQMYSLDVKLTFPRLITIFKQSSFIERSNPKTIINTSFNFEDRPEYTRMSGQMLFNYYWKSADYMSNYLSLIRLNYVRIVSMADFFRNWLETNFLKQSYEDHFIVGPNYNIVLSNQGAPGNNYYVNFNIGFSGIGLYYFYKNVLKDTAKTFVLPYTEIPFSQFIKSDVDLRYYLKRRGNTLVFREFIGIAKPFGNSVLMPAGEQFFSGGANDIRAWQIKALGPGSYKLPEDIIYPNQLGDVKIQTNLEYRFVLYKFLESALFFDIGNIWSLNKKDNRNGAVFTWNRFYKEMAVGTGLGLRLNFKFIVLRGDLGMKLKDPSLDENHRWIPLERQYTIHDFAFNFAIGYPF